MSLLGCHFSHQSFFWVLQVFLRSLLSISVAVCVLFLIVWPKVQRVLSGEKVVMSNYLGAGRASSSVSMTGESQTNTRQSEIILNKKESDSLQDHDASKEAKEAFKEATSNRIPLKKDDPLPTSVASRIVGSESLLREVTDKLYVLVLWNTMCHGWSLPPSLHFILILFAATKGGHYCPKKLLCYKKK